MPTRYIVPKNVKSNENLGEFKSDDWESDKERLSESYPVPREI